MSSQGRFVWYELITTDMAAARAFYASVVGWEMRDASMPGMAYTLCSTARGSVCGLVNVTAEAGTAGEKPCWIGYVGVDDVDAPQPARSRSAVSSRSRRRPSRE